MEGAQVASSIFYCHNCTQDPSHPCSLPLQVHSMAAHNILTIDFDLSFGKALHHFAQDGDEELLLQAAVVGATGGKDKRPARTVYKPAATEMQQQRSDMGRDAFIKRIQEKYP